jgi:hypothetical protein
MKVEAPNWGGEEKSYQAWRRRTRADRVPRPEQGRGSCAWIWLRGHARVGRSWGLAVPLMHGYVREVLE